jgi:pimeloyl-ACP methyl ester carboxylesterase
VTAGTVSVNGAEFYYEEAGAGVPIVLVHGNTVDARMWDDQMKAFGRFGRVIRYDVRGFGRSSFPHEPFAHHEDLWALLRELDASPAHLVGLSMGASIAINLALTHSDSVRSLVLTPGGLGGYAWPETFRTGFSAFAQAAQAGDKAQAMALSLAFAPMRPAAAIPALRARLEKMMSEYSWQHFSSEAPPVIPLQPPAAERLVEIAAPSLVVVGARDMDAMRAQGDFMAARIPGARVAVIPGAGHMVNMERPTDFNDVVLDFVRRC